MGVFRKENAAALLFRAAQQQGKWSRCTSHGFGPVSRLLSLCHLLQRLRSP